MRTSSVQQTSDGGYLIAGFTYSFGFRADEWILKLDSTGNILWQKIYENCHFGVVEEIPGEGYILLGDIAFNNFDTLIMKLDLNGNILRGKTYAISNIDDSANSLVPTIDGNYIISGRTWNSDTTSNYFLELDSNWDVLWQRIYDGEHYDDSVGISKQNSDGGYLLTGYTKSFGAGGYEIFLLKTDSNWEIPNCDTIDITLVSNPVVNTPFVNVYNSDALITSTSATVAATSVVPQNSLFWTSVVCCNGTEDLDIDDVADACDNCPYVYNPNQENIDNDDSGDACDADIDGDNTLNTEDNCSYQPNASALGTCISGNLGQICTGHEDCGVMAGFCSMNQEDDYPPGGNGIGDACECESDFDCDGDVDGSDATTFKLYFGRNSFFYPCNEVNPCRGDFDCDHDCDGMDASIFKLDFGRSEFNSPCPACIVGEWCGYDLSTPLPDTGQTRCYDYTQEIICPNPGEGFYGQDAQYITKPQSYTKLDENGNVLPESAPFWVIVRDNVTGLIWEVKNYHDNTIDYSNPHDADNIYYWSDSIGDGTGTEDLINLLNTEQFGGYSDWRLPTVKELTSIVNRDSFYPSINITSFPNTVPSYYWSSTTVAEFPGAAWVVKFKYGQAISNAKYTINYVRAVRGEQWGSFDNFIDNGDGTVSDTDTGLMWQQGTTCCVYPWPQALAYCENLVFAGYDDWRLPNINELQSILDYSHYEPSINTTYFPDTYGFYWSSTTNPDLLNTVFALYFKSGSMGSYYKHYYEFNVRAVRGGR